MIDSLEGTLTSKSLMALTVEVGGVGYRVHVPLSTYAGAPEVGRRVRIFTHLHVREDLLKLFGFATEDERALFRMLVGVNRVGPAVALQVLSSCPVEDFKRYVTAGDVGALSSLVKGVGKKTAQRLVLELRGELAPPAAEGIPEAMTAAASDAVKALVSLGDSSSSAWKTVRRALEKLGREADAEALMREVLSI